MTGQLCPQRSAPPGWPACSLQPGDNSHSSRFKQEKNLYVSIPSRTVFTFSFQTALGAKHRLTGLFRRPLGDLRVKTSFCVYPFPQHLHPCKGHHHTAPLPLFCYLSFAGGNRIWRSNLHLCPHRTRTGGAGGRGNWGLPTCGQAQPAPGAAAAPFFPSLSQGQELLCINDSPLLLPLLGCYSISNIKGFLRPLHLCDW